MTTNTTATAATGAKRRATWLCLWTVQLAAAASPEVDLIRRFLSLGGRDVDIAAAGDRGDQRLASFGARWVVGPTERRAALTIHRRRRFVLLASFSGGPRATGEPLAEARLLGIASDFVRSRYPYRPDRVRLRSAGRVDRPPVARYACDERAGDSYTGATVAVALDPRDGRVISYSCFVPNPDAPAPRVTKDQATARAKQLAREASGRDGWQVRHAALVRSSLASPTDGPVWNIALTLRVDREEAQDGVTLDAVRGEALSQAGG